jgi:hypothetical protein
MEIERIMSTRISAKHEVCIHTAEVCGGTKHTVAGCVTYSVVTDGHGVIDEEW